MDRNTVIQHIFSIAHDDEAFSALENFVVHETTPAILKHLLMDCGVIPESFTQNSSEEKLWAKYCDVLLSLAFNHLDIDASVIRVRGNSADVLGKTDDYSIVADAKAFRLSRTAKNQKDFKIDALDDWRRENTYACLIAPSAQYPKRRSQIYRQATAKNVTLLSYVHLNFLLEHWQGQSLQSLWEVAGSLLVTQEANTYWDAIETTLLKLTTMKSDTLEVIKTGVKQRLIELGDEGIAYWQSVIQEYKTLSRNEAIERLIKAEKVEQKIITIQQAIDRTTQN